MEENYKYYVVYKLIEYVPSPTDSIYYNKETVDEWASLNSKKDLEEFLKNPNTVLNTNKEVKILFVIYGKEVKVDKHTTITIEE